jgi:hypothetical protein
MRESRGHVCVGMCHEGVVCRVWVCGGAQGCLSWKCVMNGADTALASVHTPAASPPAPTAATLALLQLGQVQGTHPHTPVPDDNAGTSMQFPVLQSSLLWKAIDTDNVRVAAREHCSSGRPTAGTCCCDPGPLVWQAAGTQCYQQQHPYSLLL